MFFESCFGRYIGGVKLLAASWNGRDSGIVVGDVIIFGGGVEVGSSGGDGVIGDGVICDGGGGGVIGNGIALSRGGIVVFIFGVVVATSAVIDCW